MKTEATSQASTKDVASNQQIANFQMQLPNYNPFKIILIAIRLLLIAIVICPMLVFQDFIRPRIMIPSIRRYLSCVVNLISIRIVLIILGFIRFQCENYRYFDKTARMMTFRSGWVGVASRKSIIDFLYYSYMFNPTYARVVEFHTTEGIQEKQKEVIKLFYMPMTFTQAFFVSLNFRGFDPIIIKGQYEMKRFKKRKMLMPTLISQCFQQMNGPILIFLPCISARQQLKIHKKLGEDIFDNQKRFLRSGIAFVSQAEQFKMQYKQKVRYIPQIYNKIYPNQLILLAEICSQLKQNILTITATQIIKYKYEYNRQTYAEFIDQIYNRAGYTTLDMTYQQYQIKMDTICLNQDNICKQQDRNNTKQQENTFVPMKQQDQGQEQQKTKDM